VWERFKGGARNVIAQHRNSMVVRTIHRATAFFEASWHNEGTEFERNGEKVVIERLKSADFRLALDVGANVGVWTGAALQLWPNCRVHAFEVSPHTYKRLEAAVEKLLLGTRLELHGMGLAEQEGKQTMYYFPGHDELTCDSPRHESYVRVPFEANFTTLDIFCGERGIEEIDYLKIDVEGAEHRVLRGARSLLQNDKIACIQFEYGAFSIETRFLLKDYFELLSNQFVIGKIFHDHVAFGDYAWTAEDFRFCNYLCVSKNRPDLQRMLKG